MEIRDHAPIRARFSWGGVILLPILCLVLLLFSPAPAWSRWLLLLISIIYVLWFATYDVVITSSALQKKYPFRVIGRNGPSINASAITNMNSSRGTFRHWVVVKAVHDGENHKLKLEVSAYKLRCSVFDFAIRNGIPLTCHSREHRTLARQIRKRICRIDPATGHWNIPGYN